MGEHKLPKGPKKSTNIRIRIIESDELKGQPTLIVAVPTNPENLQEHVQVSAVLEIWSPDPHTGKPDWYMVDVVSEADIPDQPEPGLIQIARGKH